MIPNIATSPVKKVPKFVVSVVTFNQVIPVTTVVVANAPIKTTYTIILTDTFPTSSTPFDKSDGINFYFPPYNAWS